MNKKQIITRKLCELKHKFIPAFSNISSSELMLSSRTINHEIIENHTYIHVLNVSPQGLLK